MFASTYGHLAWTFLGPGCCFSGKKRSYYLRNFITREFFYYYCRLTLCFPLLDMIPFNYVLSLQRHLMIRRLYTSCWGRVPSSQSTSVVPMKSVELLLCTLCLSTWLNPAFFFFFKLCYSLLRSHWLSFCLCFQSLFFTEDIVGWTGIPLFQAAYRRVISYLKFSSLPSTYFVEYILVHSDTS